MIKSLTKVANSIDSARATLKHFRKSGRTTGFVPTMGALHEGHISLIRRAGELCDEIVVSVFVNPTQFGPHEDFSRYPRPVDQDLEICESEGVSLVFLPGDQEMYGSGDRIRIQAGKMAHHLCGKSRPGHFDGVLQIVNKLFNIIEPDIAVFGQKDIQQFHIIRQMVRDFKMDLILDMVPTQRESDGLAVSSRNAYLSDVERKSAPRLYRTLNTLEKEFTEKPFRTALQNPRDVIARHASALQSDGLRLDYLECVDSEFLQPVTALEKERIYILAGAVYAGKTRLIDNVTFSI